MKTIVYSISCALLFFWSAYSGATQKPVHRWKALGPFSIHKQTGETAAPGLGVFRTIEVTSKNPAHILMGGMTSGVWLSENKGRSWTNVTAGLPVENVKKLQMAASNNNIVYAATTVGVIRSTDAGRTWAFTALNLLSRLPCPDREKWSDDRSLLSVAPNDPNVVVASNSDTVFRTTDGGKSWNVVLADFQTQFIEFHPANDQIVYLGGAYRKERHRFYILRSLDGGRHFSEMTRGLPDKNKLNRLTDITAAVTPAAPEKLYVLIFGNARIKTTVKQEEKEQMVGAFMESDDAGESFHPIAQVNNYRYIDDHYSLFYPYSADEDKEKYDFVYGDHSFWQASFQQVGWATGFGISDRDARTMVMAASGAVYSRDGGHRWDYLRKQGNYHIHGDIQQVKVVGDDVWLVNDGGVNYVNLQDRNQVRLEGYSGQDLWGFSTSFKSEVMAVGVDHSGTMIYDKRLYGKDWYHYGGGDAMTATVNPFDDRYLYATPYNHQVIRRPLSLRDEPQSRSSPINLGYIPHRNLEFHPNLIYTVYGIDEDKPHWRYDTCRVVRSTDNLRTVDTLLNFPPKAYGKRVRVSTADPNYLYAICQKPGKVYRSQDGGKTWLEITPAMDTAVKLGFTDVAISDKDPKRVYVSVGGFQNVAKILSSTDGGKTWEDYHSAELPRNEILTLALQRGTDDGLYLGAYPGVFYRSRSMSHWATVGEGLPYTPVHFIALNYDQAKIRIGTYRGVWECDLSEDFAPQALIAMNKNVLPSGRSDARKVFFYDHSALRRKGAKWYWEFPGSIQKTSTDENPVIDYETAAPGRYTVRLTITDGQGRKSHCELRDFIEVKNNASWNLRAVHLKGREVLEEGTDE